MLFITAYFCGRPVKIDIDKVSPEDGWVKGECDNRIDKFWHTQLKATPFGEQIYNEE